MFSAFKFQSLAEEKSLAVLVCAMTVPLMLNIAIKDDTKADALTDFITTSS
jgi:hypothetical protein